MNNSFHSNSKKLAYYNCTIQPGQLAYSKSPTLIGAVCGNGILVVICDRIKKIGGIAHCIYPKRKFSESPSNLFAETAIQSLVRSLRLHQSRSHNMEAQIFGGGHRFNYKKGRAENVIKRARKTLKKLDINIVSEDTGGCIGRKIIFNTYSGEILVNRTRNVRRTDWIPELKRRQRN